MPDTETERTDGSLHTLEPGDPQPDEQIGPLTEEDERSAALDMQSAETTRSIRVIENESAANDYNKSAVRKAREALEARDSLEKPSTRLTLLLRRMKTFLLK
jgi:hypothetical protein